MDVERLKQRAAGRIDAAATGLDGLALAIHDRPELAFAEHFASSALADFVVAAGYPVARGAGGLETAFVSETRANGGPTIAICSEYDALAGIGHGCGHNLIATAGAGADLRGPAGPSEPQGAG